jgi:hypothetical protein
MVSIDPEVVIELSNEMTVLQERIAVLRADMFHSEKGIFLWEMNYLGGDGAPWVPELKESWNSVVESRSAEADTVSGVLEKIRLNLLFSAAEQMKKDGESAADFASTGASLEDHASGEFFEDW